MTELTADPGTGMPEGSRTPWHFWLASIVSLLWNAFGAYLYTMANLGAASVTAKMPPEMKAYAASMPIWAHTGWAIGIWGSLAGSLLLLIRSRHAEWAFAASLAGAIVSYVAQAQAGVLTPVQPIVIVGAIVLQWWYARRMRAAGVLR
ncbi:hypothetical protein [Tsuneonella rigui]|uniref:hypothetical protein n=1 Tax=Tsuneonella rigui TaxID=1708790 RepID=UPI000F7DB1FC|nr:hypothetical protein [Tsuneonella rigui]